MWLQRVAFWLISPLRSRSIPDNMPATSRLSLYNPTRDMGQILVAYPPTWTHNPGTCRSQRWRPEDLGSFDPNMNDIHTFAGRIREVAEIRDSSWFN